MRVTGIDLYTVPVNHRGSWTFLQIRTDTEVRGLAELNPSALRRGCQSIIQEMAEYLKGRDPRNIEALTSGLNPVTLGYAGVLALSAIDTALWDILAKSLQVPLYRLLGGRCHDDIHVYANINRATTVRTPAGFAENAAAAFAEGFDAIKLAPFDGVDSGIDSSADARNGIECMHSVREAIGPGAALLIDCHSHFTLRGAMEVAEALSDLDLYWFEEPLPYDDVAGYQSIRQHLGVTLAGAENRQLRQGFWDVMVHGMMDVIMPDVTIVGGISELRKVADMAHARGIPTAPHGPFGPVTLAAGVHAMTGHPGFKILEYAWGEVPWRQDLVTPSESIAHGRIAPNELPGLGVELNMETIRRIGH